MKKVFIITLFLLISSTHPTFAHSDYVLPYPASMPGSKFYALQEFKNSLMKHWYFGNFGQFTYNLNQADKFLVEAKILFEYRQYLLAYNALKKSDNYFLNAPTFLENSKKEKKDISQKKKILKDAALKHIEVLENLKKSVPANFTWRPEKSGATVLNLEKDLDNSIMIRTKEL